MPKELSESLFLTNLIAQVRALDQFGSWENRPDEALLREKFVKTKEQLAEIPVIADVDEEVISHLKMLLQAVAVGFERKTGQMAGVVLEMSHEGFGRGVVLCGPVVLMDKTFRDAHRFSFLSLDKLAAQGDQWLTSALKTYERFKPCLN